MALPKEGTSEWLDEVKFYVNSKEPDRIKRAKKHNIKLSSYERLMRKRGIKLNGEEHNVVVETQVDPIVNLPPIELQYYNHPEEKEGDEEEALLHISDGHAGKITVSFDGDVYNYRMEYLFESVMKIITLHRKAYPVRKLHILMTGDNIQGENPFQGSKIGAVSMGARDQTIKLAYPAMVRLIGSLAQEFEEIEVECVKGNHGASKLAPETSSEDLRLYDLLKVYFGSHKRIKINIHEGFSAIVNINGFRCFVFHGDGIQCQQGVPFFALDKKLKSWYMQYGGFQYAFGGHFHKRHSDEISSRLEYFMCSTLVSDDDWALKQLGISSNPSQGLYGVHPRYGVTWRYAVQVDKKFLPDGGN
jgi:hypothetical protein